MPITLIENFRAVFYAPFYAAFALGAYAAEGLEVHLMESSRPSETANALLTGKGEVAWGGPMRVMVANNRNPDCGLLLFCEVVARDPFFLVGREPHATFQVKDLLGKKLATVSEVPTPWICLQHDLRLAELDPAEIDRVADRSMPGNVAALRSGGVDVIQVFQPYVENLLEENAGHIWYAAADRGLTSYTALYTTRRFMERNSEAILRMTRAVYRAQRWIAAHDGEELAARVAAYFPDLPQETLAKALTRYKALGLWNRTPILSQEGFEWLQSACLSGGLIQKGFPYEHCVDMRFAEQVIGEEVPAL
jgi:NitT/TauT family transport system substrate-binding protein